jgi:lysophospholipase
MALPLARPRRQENVPLAPFLVPYRNVDAIIAFDNSADTSYAWPNGSSLHVSYQKAIDQERVYGITSRMPQVPSTNGFINGGYNTRPTFFGCNDTDTTLIVYVPNAPWSTYSNTTTFQLAYPTEQAAAIVDNGRRTLDLNGTVADWPTCLTCALMDRAATENGTARSSTCQKCFDTWCWKGDDNTTQPASYEPVLGVAPQFILDLTNSTGGEGVSYGSGSQRLDASYARWGGVLTVVIGMYVMLL